MAETDVAGVADDESAALCANIPLTTPDDAAARRLAALGDIPLPSGETPPTPTRMTFLQHVERSVLIAAVLLVSAVLLAPIALAVIAAIWALVTDTLATVTIVQLIQRGSLLETGDAMSALSIASRIGFLAVGYLGFFFALMSLLAGLLGRGRGRLFIIPGALLTASGLVLLATSVALCWPLLAPLHATPGALIAIGAYFALDAIAVATLLADTHETRRRWRAARRRRAPTATKKGKSPSGMPPTLART